MKELELFFFWKIGSSSLTDRQTDGKMQEQTKPKNEQNNDSIAAATPSSPINLQ